MPDNLPARPPAPAAAIALQTRPPLDPAVLARVRDGLVRLP